MINSPNRLGRFRISGQTLRHEWRDLLLLFAQVVPVAIRHDWSSQGNDYTGYSDLFEEISDGMMPPFYEFEFTRHLDGRVDITCKRATDPEAL